MKYCLLFILLLSIQSASGLEYLLNESPLRVDARDMALGGLVCSLDRASNRCLECTYLLPFQLKELSTRSLSFRTSVLGMNWSVGWAQTGDVVCMENMMKLHLGKRLSERLHVGVEVDVLLLQDVTENSSSACFSGIDCLYTLTDKLSLGFTCINPSGARLATDNGKIPMNIAAFLAAKYNPAKSCSLYAEACSWTNQTFKGRLGLEYVLSKTFFLRTGFSTNPCIPSWGIGGNIHRISYSWGGNVHPILGFSNGFSLKYSW